MAESIDGAERPLRVEELSNERWARNGGRRAIDVDAAWPRGKDWQLNHAKTAKCR
jgi:hypothetical protein